MKRHTAEPRHFAHNERASIAVRLARIVRRAIKPARLYWLAMEQRNAEDHISDLVSMSEAIPRDIVRMHRVTIQLEEKRLRIERGLA